MLPEKIMQSDLLDILFENKNKMYGAYALRRSYNKRIASAITVTCFVALGFSVIQSIHHSNNRDRAVTFIIPDDNVLVKIDDTKPLPKVEPAQHVAATPANQIINSTPVIASDNDKTDVPTTDDLVENIIGPEKIIGKAEVDAVQAPIGTNVSPGNSTAQPEETKVDDAPLYTAEVMPQYPGGVEALKKFMLKNLRQPDDLQEGEKIIVMASFVVNKNGEIEAVKILNDGRSDLNKEVMRVINKMPLWRPGMQNGNAVAVYFNLPVTFTTGQ